MKLGSFADIEMETVFGLSLKMRWTTAVKTAVQMVHTLHVEATGETQSQPHFISSRLFLRPIQEAFYIRTHRESPIISDFTTKMPVVYSALGAEDAYCCKVPCDGR